MVWFQCEDCGESIKKPKLQSHFHQCRASRFSCIDCLLVFDRSTVMHHTSCVTEHEKYALSATKPGGFASSGFNSASVSGANGANSGEAVGLEHTSSRPPWKCFLCNVNCTSKENLLAHAASKKHRNKYKRTLCQEVPAQQQQQQQQQPKEVIKAQGKEESVAGEVVAKPKEESGGKGSLAGRLSRELGKWSKHTRKVLDKKGDSGRLAVKKLGKHVVKRIEKKVKKKLTKAEREDIESTWKKRLETSGEYRIQGKIVLLKET